MTDENIIKNYPSATSEVAKMLNIDNGEEVAEPTHDLSSLPVANLPVAAQKDIHAPQEPVHAPKGNDHTHKEPAQAKSTFAKIGKAVLPYLAIFIVGLFLYYFFFTAVNFGALFQSGAPKASTPQESSEQALLSQDSAQYYAWINGFYFDVTDPNIIAPDTDNSGNGFTNFEKYLLGLNPKAYDTLNLGMPDSQTVSQGIDPNSGGPLTDSQKNVLAKYIDMEVVMNRLTLSNLQNPGQVAGSSTSQVGGSSTPGTIRGAPTQTQNTDLQPAQVQDPSTQTADSPVAPDNSVDINTSIPGRLEIPDLKINVPIIWSQSVNNFESDLQIGVIHYPGTAMPGQIGTTYIAGHSSNYFWAKGSYNQIFATLGKLAPDTSFKITVVQQNGQNAIFHYVVIDSKQYLPTDQAQFANTGKSLVALSTCWPVDTTSKRLVVYGELTQVEK